MNMYIVISTIFLSAYIFPLSSRSDDNSTKQSADGSAYDLLLRTSEDEIAHQYLTFPSKLDEVTKSIVASFALGKEIEQISGEVDNKKTTDERRSILQKQIDEKTASLEQLLKTAFRIAPIPFIGFINSTPSEQKKNSSANFKKVRRDLLRQNPKNTFIKSGNASISFACVKQSIAADKKCLESALKFCKTRYSSKNGKLRFEYLDSNLNRISTVYNTASEAHSDLIEREKRSKDVDIELPETLADMVVGICGKVATSGYEFTQSDIFIDNAEKFWAYELMTSDLTSDSLLKICPAPNSQVVKNLLNERKTTDLAGSAVQIIEHTYQAYSKRCLESVETLCSSMEKLKENIMVLHYITSACTKRVVTFRDIQSDIKQWKSLNIGTEADQLRHAEIAERIKFCQEAAEQGYEWQFEAPSTKDCKVEN